LHKLKRMLQFGNIDGSWKVDRPESLASTIHSILVGEIIKLLIEPSEEAAQLALLRIYDHLEKLLVIPAESLSALESSLRSDK
jgi:hypothetical protein